MYLGSCLAPFKIMGHAPEVTYLIWPKNWATLCMDVFSIMCLFPTGCAEDILHYSQALSVSYVEILDYYHVPGHAVLHCGRHRHGARATTSGHRMNLLLWCRSAVFRELKKYQKDFSSWCAVCQHEKKERQRVAVATTKLELLKRDGNPAP
ncbi:putative PKHD-type hydroxylase [Vitis vinifera]|uniref:Putative PKHD-type hydroxylase n=1 Tax=Vitis vinifera TaxID=29760 RepID=A0A438JUE1_VITVI|nr:putative PKHD-type hydroxylase [Vitis vinifera]